MKYDCTLSKHLAERISNHVHIFNENSESNWSEVIQKSTAIWYLTENHMTLGSPTNLGV